MTGQPAPVSSVDQESKNAPDSSQMVRQLNSPAIAESEHLGKSKQSVSAPYTPVEDNISSIVDPSLSHVKSSIRTAKNSFVVPEGNNESDSDSEVIEPISPRSNDTRHTTPETDDVSEPDDVSVTNSHVKKASTLNKKQPGMTRHPRPFGISVPGPLPSGIEPSMSRSGLPTPASPSWADHPQKTVVRANGEEVQCIEVYCRQQKTNLRVSSIQKITNQLIYQLEDRLPDGRPDYIQIPLDCIEEVDGRSYVVNYQPRESDNGGAGDRVYTPHTPNKRGTGYVFKNNGDMPPIPRFVEQVQAERAHQISEREGRAEKEAEELKKEEVFFVFLTVLSLAILALVRPFSYAILALLGNVSIFSAALSTISQTVRHIFQRALERIAALLVAFWHKFDAWFSHFHAVIAGQWQRLRTSRAAGVAFSVTSNVRMSLVWLYAQVMKALQYLCYMRYRVLIAIVLATFYYIRGIYDGLLAFGPSIVPSPETRTAARLVTRETATSAPNGWKTRQSLHWRELKALLYMLIDGFKLVTIPRLVEYFDWTRLITLTVAIVTLPLGKVGYSTIVDWLRRKCPVSLISSDGPRHHVRSANTNTGGSSNVSPFVHKFLAGLVYIMEMLKGKWAAIQTNVRNVAAGIVGQIGTHCYKIASLTLVALVTADYALSLGLTSWLNESIPLAAQALRDNWNRYPNVRYSMVAIILSVLFRRLFFAALGWLRHQVAIHVGAIWSLLTNSTALANIYYRGLKDFARAVVEVAWEWPWKWIVRGVVGLVMGTVWLAGTICLGIWVFYELKGPLPMLDMMIKYSDGEDGPRVRVVQ